MLLHILEIVISVYACIYVLFSVVIAIGEKRLKTRELPDELPNVSVIVCARNEEKNITRCLDHLVKLDYPREKIELFLVDDESEDATLSIMEEYALKDSMFRVLSTEGEPRDLPAKQRPMNMGIRKSTGEIILITDADIAVRPGWVKAHLSAYHENIGIAGATTRVDVSSGRLYDHIQCCDLIIKHAVAMGCAGLGFPLSLMGNNFSFRRNAYDMVGGLPALNHSIVEDMALMNAIVRSTGYTQGWVTGREGVVVSAPEKDFGTFIEQRLRWVYELTDLSMIGKIMLTVESLMLLVFILSLVIVSWNFTPLVATVLAWIFGYFIILTPSPGNEKNDVLYIPGMLLFQIIYGFVFGWRKLFKKKKVVWKGRVFEE